MVAQSPEPGAHVLNARAFRIESEFRNVGFCGEGKTGVPGEKPRYYLRDWHWLLNCLERIFRSFLMIICRPGIDFQKQFNIIALKEQFRCFFLSFITCADAKDNGTSGTFTKRR